MAGSAKIASLDIFLRGNNQDLQQKLDGAGVSLQQFKGKVNQQTQQINQQLNSIGNGVSANVQNAFLNPVAAIQSALSRVASYVGRFLTDPVGTAKQTITSLVATCRVVGDGIIKTFSNVAGNLYSLFRVPVAAIGNVFAGIGKAIVNPIGTIKGLFSGINLNGIVSAVANPIGTIKGLFSSLAGTGASFAGLLSTALGGIGLAAVAAGAAIVGLAGAGLYLANTQATVIGSIKKLADTLNMSVDAFSGLQGASGIEVEAFGSGIEHLQRQLSEAALNGGDTARALARVGLDARQLAGSLPEDQLGKLSIAFANVKNQADRLKLGETLFGRGAGMDFTRILQNGTDGLNTLLARSERFGLVFSEQEAETVKRSNKAWGEWKLGLEGIGRSLAIALAPMWEEIGLGLGELFANISQWVRQSAPFITRLWVLISGMAKDIWAGLVPVFQILMKLTGITSLTDAFGNTAADAQHFLDIVQQSWNVFKGLMATVTQTVSDGWALIVQTWNDSISFLADITKPFWDWISSGFALMVGNINESTGQLTRGNFVQTLASWEWAFRHLTDVIALALKMWQLKFVEFKIWIRPVFVEIAGWINSLIDGWNSVARRVGLSPITGRVQVIGVDDFRAEERRLQREIETFSNNLGVEMNDFINQRMNQLNRQQGLVQQQMRKQNPPQADFNNTTQLAEKGTQEAFKIIAQSQGDKQFAVLNDILKELQEADRTDKEVLRELQRRLSVQIARL